MKLFLFSLFFLYRSTSSISHLLFEMADFRVHVVNKGDVVCLAENKGICHLHQFTISNVGGDATAFNVPFTRSIRFMVHWGVHVCTFLFTEFSYETL